MKNTLVIDTSALLAILLQEAEAQSFFQKIVAFESRIMSAANYLECSLRVDYTNNILASQAFDDLFKKLRIKIADVTEEQARIARSANQAYGKGSTHPAKLNFGDCFAYALAKDLDCPLLFKGNDFIHTDLKLPDLEQA